MTNKEQIKSLESLALHYFPIDKNNGEINKGNEVKRDIYFKGVVDTLSIVNDNDGWIRIDSSYPKPDDNSFVVLYSGSEMRIAKYKKQYDSYEPIAFSSYDEFHYNDADFYKVINIPIYTEKLRHE
jgi:hypothetical protein